jgi:hypothetical protein
VELKKNFEELGSSFGGVLGGGEGESGEGEGG